MRVPLDTWRNTHFVKILNEAEAPFATVHYGKPVVHVKYTQDDGGLHRVVTSDGTVFVAPVVVAADGFHSTLRKLWNIPMDGQEGIQHLINVHIRVNDNDGIIVNVTTRHVVCHLESSARGNDGATFLHGIHFADSLLSTLSNYGTKLYAEQGTNHGGGSLWNYSEAFRLNRFDRGP